MSTVTDRTEAELIAWAGRLGAVMDRSLSWLDLLGDQLVFYLRALLWVPRAIHRYSREIFRLLAEVSFGSGALGLIGGTVGVVLIAMYLPIFSIAGKIKAE